VQAVAIRIALVVAYKVEREDALHHRKLKEKVICNKDSKAC